MKIFSSLTNRIFLASAVLTVVAIAIAVYRVNVAVTAQAENELRRGIDEAGKLLEEYRTTLFEHYAREGRLVADLSNMKAAMYERDRPPVEPIAERYQRQIGCDLLLVTDPAGAMLAESGRLTTDNAASLLHEAIADARHGKETVSLWPHTGGVIQVVTVPSFTGPEFFGTVSIGFSLDAETAQRFKRLTNSEIIFAVNRHVEASTLPDQFGPQLETLARTDGVQVIRLGQDEYVAVNRVLPLQPLDQRAAPTKGPLASALILRSRTERLRFLNAVHRELAVTAFLAVMAATLVSYAVARTVTRPLDAITATMREMAATGDLTRKIALSPSARWEDEDARLLANTFNTMTDSIARFQREAAQRERLSSLGRLSTVGAHEIRNPLMVIKYGLRTLRRDDLKPEQTRAVAHDIDEEIARLNRIVAEVLDFARPIKFDLAPADLNALARDAVKAADAGAAHAKIRLDLDDTIPAVTTDA